MIFRLSLRKTNCIDHKQEIIIVHSPLHYGVSINTRLADMWFVSFVQVGIYGFACTAQFKNYLNHGSIEVDDVCYQRLITIYYYSSIYIQPLHKWFGEIPRECTTIISNPIYFLLFFISLWKFRLILTNWCDPVADRLKYFYRQVIWIRASKIVIK